MTAWDPKALDRLQSYNWPGNVRELRNIVHRAYVMTEGKTIRPEVVAALLPASARGAAPASKRKGPAKPARPAKAVASRRKK